MQNKPTPRPAPEWKRWHVVTLAAMAAFIFGIAALLNAMSDGSSPADHNTSEASVSSIAEAQACKTSAPREEDVMLRTDSVLRQAPAADARAIINPASPPAAHDRDTLASVTMDVPLRQMCEEAGWARVRVLATGLRWMEGWVSTAALQSLKLNSQGRRTLTKGDIDWQPGSERDRTAILKVANLILRDDRRCEAIDSRSLLVERKGRERRYTLVCDGPAGAHPIAFSASDTAGRSFAMAAIDADVPVAEPIDKITALGMCTDAIRSSLQQPDSADFDIFTDTTFHVEGARARFTVGFSAKNGLGLEKDATAACIFEGTQLTSAEILPSGS